MKAKKKYYLIFICFISIAITNISITTSSNSNFNIVLNNLEAIASSGEGSGPSLKEFSCFTGETGNPKDIYLPIEKYCGNCKSARVEQEQDIVKVLNKRINYDEIQKNFSFSYNSKYYYYKFNYSVL